MNSQELTAGQQSARTLAALLETHSLRIVLAESCTCGMAAALLGSVPGISNHLCGSAVTYRPKTKSTWLGLDDEQIERDSAESAETTRNMAIGVLQRTPEALWSASITGNLGPEAGNEDGVVFVCVAKAPNEGLTNSKTGRSAQDITIVVNTVVDLNTGDRCSRQIEAASLLLDQLASAIQASKK